MACLDDAVIARYVRGESSPEETAAVRAHLPGCPSCEVRVAQAEDLLRTGERSLETERVSGVSGMATLPSGIQPAVPLLERGATVGRYLIIDKLGEGGMGVVYAAYDPELNRKVAVKILRARPRGDREENQARLMREARALARVTHPNVISVYDVGPHGDSVFVAMELVEGQTLYRWVKAAKRPWRKTVAVLLEAGRGLAAAHAAGLVHRDFKPENVLIGNDGRVKVVDFGLARLDTSPSGSTELAFPAVVESAASSDASFTLTQAGEVMGTPQYMSPEQRLGHLADPRSDQFSFCAALYWALYRKTPFDPMQLAAVALEAMDAPTRQPGELNRAPEPPDRQVIREPPREPSVPGWLKRAMMRGLALSPADRFPTMDALLAAMSEDREVFRRRLLGGGAALAIAAAGALAFLRLSGQADSCSQVAQHLSGTWDPTIEGAVESAFRVSGKPYAVDSFATVKRVVDAYAKDWVGASRELCQVTARHEQPQQLLSLRAVCLDRRLKELKALTQLLSTPDADMVEHAVEAAHALPRLASCSDVEMLTLPVLPPEDPAARDKMERLRAVLATSKALLDAGQYKRGVELSQVAVQLADEIKYLPLSAEARGLLGWLQVKNGNAKAGEENLAEAVWLAEEGRSDEVLGMAAARLVYAVGYVDHRFDEAQPWSRLATAALNRIGDSGDARIELLYNQASMKLAQRKWAEALDLFGRTAKLAGPHHPKHASLLISEAIAHRRQNAFPKARALLSEALDVIAREQGPNHPAAAYAHFALYQVYRSENDHAHAETEVRRAIAIWEAALGLEHPNVGSAYFNLGTVYFDQKRYADALEAYEHAVKIYAKAPPNAAAGNAYLGLGASYTGLGKYREAIPLLEKAMPLLAKESNEPAVQFELAKALWGAGVDKVRAVSLAKQARDGFRTMDLKSELADVDAWLARKAR